ncbi:MAG TPA: TonB-dependent receptor plug domain-containing protein, partial [Terriglobales bacterium]|nr:TonB-dependent receptor plug domain-containing protein [Terriglobales bacterium]
MRIIRLIGGLRHPRTLLAAFLATGLTSFLAGPAAAQARKTSAFADTTKPVMFLKETVVTGSRYPRAYYESPQPLSLISRRELAESAPAVLGDVLATLPGVESNKDSPWEQRPSIRGLTGQRVLVLVDGTPMNSMRGNGPHSSLVDPSQVERIEVVRGPS